MPKGELVVIDCRAMEPPRPMIEVLEALETLPQNAQVKMLHRMRPVHLLPILTTRGFDYAFEVEEDDYIELLIWPQSVRRR